eukprot:4698823-Prymnesium_polylepis.1
MYRPACIERAASRHGDAQRLLLRIGLRAWLLCAVRLPVDKRRARCCTRPGLSAEWLQTAVWHCYTTQPLAAPFRHACTARFSFNTFTYTRMHDFTGTQEGRCPIRTGRH